MKVYFKIEDSDNHEQNKLIGLLYENFVLKIKLACAPIENIVAKEDGFLMIEKDESGIPQIRYEGFSHEVKLIIQYCIAGMNPNGKPVDFSPLFKKD